MELRQLPSGQTLTLPDDLSWVDEHQWTPAVASASYLLTGALLIESATRQAGRPITLQAPDDMAWVSRTIVDQLYTWASMPERTFELQRKHSPRPILAQRAALLAKAQIGSSAS
jgi:hypothetical protein